MEAWISDGLMGVFFFVVGLEIKRELIAGDLASVRKAMLPAVAALGGMVVPAVAYAAVNVGTPSSPGWGIPMATDIAFALGVLSLFHKRVSHSLVVFLTAVAIVDDIGAILVIAIFYSESISLVSLGIGAAFLSLAALGNRLGMRNSLVYFIIGTCVWLAFSESGVHATVAAVLMAFTIPSRPRIQGEPLARELVSAGNHIREVGVVPDGELPSEQQHEALRHLAAISERSTGPLQRLEHELAPLVALIVLPLFALANAGVEVTGSFAAMAASPLFTGVLIGLIAGKPLGILLFTWLAIRLGVADPPSGTRWPELVGVGILAGIGFTMSLFINGLAFTDEALQTIGKISILLASSVAGVLGSVVLWAATRRNRVPGD